MSDDATRVLTPVGGGDRTMVVGGFGATEQMPMGGPGDAMRTQMGGTTVCPVCSSTTPVMETYCGDCGYLLTSAPPENLEIPVEEAPPAELVETASGRRHRLHAGVNTVGRQGTDVIVSDGTVSRVHARITLDGETIQVEDLGSTNGTKVGDQRISANQPTSALPGTPLKFGSWQVTIEADAARFAGSGDATIVLGGATSAASVAEQTEAFGQSADAPAADLPLSAEPNADVVAAAWLRHVEGPGVDIALPVGTVTIGRRPGNTIVITSDAYISGRHAELMTDETGTYLTDVGSTNGTRVNGQKLAAGVRQALLEGDSIQLGQTRYQYEPAALEPMELGGLAASPDGEFGADE
jgi:pSer/pThr/pTyr-binding forkhead associated (FHA) protein